MLQRISVCFGNTERCFAKAGMVTFHILASLATKSNQRGTLTILQIKIEPEKLQKGFAVFEPKRKGQK